MTLERSLPEIPMGQIVSPLKPCFTGMSPNYPTKDMFVGERDTSGKPRIRNTSRKNHGDGHDTMTTGRSLPKGSVSTVAHDWLYETPADLLQVGRNLILQLQMSGSPIFAISTLNGRLTAVTRVAGVLKRFDLGPIPWGHYFYPVARCKLADSAGEVQIWLGVDDYPDVNAAPKVAQQGDTWQGTTGHHTLGHYRDKSKGGVYVGFFSAFGRAADPLRAIELAR